jgi:hypothetical protein
MARAIPALLETFILACPTKRYPSAWIGIAETSTTAAGVRPTPRCQLPNLSRIAGSRAVGGSGSRIGRLLADELGPITPESSLVSPPETAWRARSYLSPLRYGSFAVGGCRDASAWPSVSPPARGGGLRRDHVRALRGLGRLAAFAALSACGFVVGVPWGTTAS